MNKENKEIIIRARGVLICDGKMLVVKHREGSYYALPGRHLEYGEDPLRCIEREIFEELGIKPKIGRLLYVNTFISGEKQTVEFIFEIENAKDYFDNQELKGTHTHEILEMRWVKKDEQIDFMPKDIFTDFQNDQILSDSVKFIG